MSEAIRNSLIILQYLATWIFHFKHLSRCSPSLHLLQALLLSGVLNLSLLAWNSHLGKNHLSCPKLNICHPNSFMTFMVFLLPTSPLCLLPVKNEVYFNIPQTFAPTDLCLPSFLFCSILNHSHDIPFCFTTGSFLGVYTYPSSSLKTQDILWKYTLGKHCYIVNQT